MSTPSTSLPDEVRLAATGSVRMVAGRHDAALFFGTDMRSLAGALLAYVLGFALSLALQAVMLASLGADSAISSSQALMTTGLQFLGQTAGTFAALTFLRKSEKLVPYLVADTWIAAFLSVATALATFSGLSAEAIILVVGLITLIAKVNIARLTAGLRVPGIILVVVAQLFGAGIVGFFALGILLGPVTG